MKKIPTLFLRDPSNPLRVTDQVNSVCQWVVDNEGIATRKWDGQPILIQDGLLFKRYTGDLRGFSGNPLGAISCGEEEDTTPVWWVLVSYRNEDKHIRAAMELQKLWGKANNGTYEIVGPNFCHNREKVARDCLVRHGSNGIFPDAPTNFTDLFEWLSDVDIEGLVWHHPDGRMAKIKKSDLGLRRAFHIDTDGQKIHIFEHESDMPEFRTGMRKPLSDATEHGISRRLADGSYQVFSDSEVPLAVSAAQEIELFRSAVAGETTLPSHYDIGGEG